MEGLTREQKRECISVLSTDMLISAFESIDKNNVEESILLRDELIKRLNKVDPTSRRSKGYISIYRRNNNGKKSMRLEVKDHGFNTLYVGDMTLEDFAEFVAGCEVKIQREE